MTRSATQRPLVVTAFVYLILLIYGSWVPLNLSPVPLESAIDRFINLPFGEQGVDSVTDWATNGILLIPLTLLMGQRIKRALPESGKLISVVLAALAGILVALFLEFSQIYFPPRTVSQKDILALSLGGILGALAQLRWGCVVEHWLNILWRLEQGRSGLIRILQAYLVVVLLFSVLPLDLTISVVELYHKWREGRLVLMPFGSLKGNVAEIAYELISDLLIWLPAGMLLAFERRTKIFGTAILTGLMALGIEVMQLFVYSRVTDITDPLLATVGGGIGGFLAKREDRLNLLISGLSPGHWYRAWIAWAIVVLVPFWFPFNFVVTQDLPERGQEMLIRLPFLTLYQGTEFQAINEIFRKIAFFVPGGLLWGMACTTGKGFSGSKARTGLFAMLILASFIEMGQLLLPGKIAETTDILLCTFGGWLGLRIAGALRSKDWHLLKDMVQQTAMGGTLNPPAVVPRQPRVSSSQMGTIIAFLTISLSLVIIVRLPGVPYNIKELVAPGLLGIVSITCISLTLLWVINAHFLWLKSEQSAFRVLSILPLWLIFHAIVTWTLLRIGVPLESIHDIVGSPVLGWAWEFEMIGRYVALHSSYTLALVGAIVVSWGFCGQRSKRLILVWAVWCLLLSWLLHDVVVTHAATDNLTELMRENGQFPYAPILFLGIFLATLTATLLACLVAHRNYPTLSGGLIFLAVTCGIACLWFGSEPMIIKYGKFFSAWQFLLSPDRNHYVSGLQLQVHFTVAFCGYVGLVAALQYPFWKSLPSGKQPRHVGWRNNSRVIEPNLYRPCSHESYPRKTHHDIQTD